MEALVAMARQIDRKTGALRRVGQLRPERRNVPFFWISCHNDQTAPQ
jgi:hypothetical protein